MGTSNEGWAAALKDMVNSGELCHRVCSHCAHDRYFPEGELVNCPLCGGNWIDGELA